MNLVARASRVVVLAALPTLAQAQVRATPGVVIDGKVATTIYITMIGDEPPGRPVPGVRILLISERSDTVQVLTDPAGAKTVMLAPGLYRLTTGPVEWRGNGYQWDLRLAVAPGIRIVELTQRNASRTALTMSPPTAIATGPTKDESTAQVLSFLVAGTGQMYAGETGKGAALLVVGLVGDLLLVDGLRTQASCKSDSACRSSNGGEVALAGLAIGAFARIYSLTDADNAVRRWNAAHRMSARIRIAPFAGPGRLGLRLTPRSPGGRRSPERRHAP